MANRIYAYTVVGKDAEPWERVSGQSRTTGTGLVKVGQTTKRTARERIKQQLGTAYPNLDGVKILLDEPAAREDGTEFSDHDVHAALVKQGIRRPEGEWFEATLDEVRAAINTVRSGVPFDAEAHRLVSDAPGTTGGRGANCGLLREHAGNDRRRRSSSGTPRCASVRPSRPISSPEDGLEADSRPHLQAGGAGRMARRLARPCRLRWLAFHRPRHADRRGRHAASGSDPVVWFASFQDLNGKTAGRRDQGPQRDDPPDRLGLHRPRRVPLRRLARLGPRPLRPDRQGDSRGRGARGPGDRGGPRSHAATLPLPLRHAVPGDH